MPAKKKSKKKKVESGEVRVRFAPAPTGALHIGNSRTALFNYLFTKRNKGKMILRIEDTDIERSGKDFEKDIMENLKWLGIEWDEGPVIENQKYIGDYGPYRQMERLDIYEKYLQRLLDEGKAYYCFCSQEELETQKQYQLSQGMAPKYSGHCASLSKDEINKCLAKNDTALVRFATPRAKISFIDIIRGKIEFDANLIGDFPIARILPSKSGQTKRRIIPLYNFAVVIDDCEMKLTHIIRGEDLLPNMPKQIFLQESLGFYHPEYGHLPLILGPDRGKLSKRHGALAIDDYKAQGYLPEAMINMLAFLGWNPGGNQEYFTLNELIKEFSLERVQKSGAVFNIAKLDHINSYYIKQKTIEELAELCLPYLIKDGLIKPVGKKYFNPKNNEEFSIRYIQKVIFTNRDRIKKLSDIVGLTDYFFSDKLNYEKEMFRWKGSDNDKIIASLDFAGKILAGVAEKDFKKEKLEKILLLESQKFAEEKFNTEDRGYLLWPLRVALSSKQASASPFEIADVLSKEKTLDRVKKAKIFVSKE